MENIKASGVRVTFEINLGDKIFDVTIDNIDNAKQLNAVGLLIDKINGEIVEKPKKKARAK